MEVREDMKKLIAFVLAFTCLFAFVGCMKQEPLVFSSAVLCPNCGFFRNEDEDNCQTCETKEMLVDQIISERQREEVSPPQRR